MHNTSELFLVNTYCMSQWTIFWVVITKINTNKKSMFVKINAYGKNKLLIYWLQIICKTLTNFVKKDIRRCVTFKNISVFHHTQRRLKPKLWKPDFQNNVKRQKNHIDLTLMINSGNASVVYLFVQAWCSGCTLYMRYMSYITPFY